MDILLDLNRVSLSYGDAVWVNGPLQKEQTTQPFIQVVAQRLYIKLTCFTGEWVLNTQYGVPYWNILGQKVSKASVDLILQQKILEERGVKELISFSSTLQNRQYSLTFRVRVVTGEISEPITITPLL